MTRSSILSFCKELSSKNEPLIGLFSFATTLTENFLAVSISFFAFLQITTSSLSDSLLKDLVCALVAIGLFQMLRYISKLPSLKSIYIAVFLGIFFSLILEIWDVDKMARQMLTSSSKTQLDAIRLPLILIVYFSTLHVGTLTNLSKRFAMHFWATIMISIVPLIMIVPILAITVSSQFDNLCSALGSFCQGGYLYLSISQTIIFSFLSGLLGLFYLGELFNHFTYLAKLSYLPRWIQEREDPYKFRRLVLFFPFVFILIYLYFDRVIFFTLYLQLISFSAVLTILRIVDEQQRICFGFWKTSYFSLSLIALFGIVLALLFRENILQVVGIVFVLALLLKAINISYRTVDAQLQLKNGQVYKTIADVVVVPFADLDLSVLRVLEYAVRLTKNVIAINLNDSDLGEHEYAQRITPWLSATDRVTIYHLGLDGKDYSTRVVEYLSELASQPRYEGMVITVIIPELIPMNLLLQPFYADSLRMKLRGYDNIILVDVRLNI